MRLGFMVWVVKFPRERQVSICPWVTASQLPVLLVYSVEQSKRLFFAKKARTELNCQKKHPFIFVLIIPKAVKVNEVTQRQIETWGEVQN